MNDAKCNTMLWGYGHDAKRDAMLWGYGLSKGRYMILDGNGVVICGPQLSYEAAHRICREHNHMIEDLLDRE
jgi:hypothetical protein